MAETLIEGRVIGMEAVVSLILRGPDDQAVEVETVIDTGCTAPLVLPAAVAEELNLPLLMTEQAELADGSKISCPVYECRVDWGRESRRIRVTSAGPYSLLGMSLLEQCRLTIDVMEQGRVAIQAISETHDVIN